jgi:hypothetical protein
VLTLLEVVEQKAQQDAAVKDDEAMITMTQEVRKRSLKTQALCLLHQFLELAAVDSTLKKLINPAELMHECEVVAVLDSSSDDSDDDDDNDNNNSTTTNTTVNSSSGSSNDADTNDDDDDDDADVDVDDAGDDKRKESVTFAARLVLQTESDSSNDNDDNDTSVAGHFAVTTFSSGQRWQWLPYNLDTYSGAPHHFHSRRSFIYSKDDNTSIITLCCLAANGDRVPGDVSTEDAFKVSFSFSSQSLMNDFIAASSFPYATTTQRQQVDRAEQTTTTATSASHALSQSTDALLCLSQSRLSMSPPASMPSLPTNKIHDQNEWLNRLVETIVQRHCTK